MEALAVNPRLHPAYFGLGLLYLRKNNLEKAEKSFQSAIEIKRDYAPAYRGLGETGEVKKDLAMAVNAYQKALLFGKENPSYAKDAAIAQFRLSQIGETPEMALAILEHDRLGKSYLKEKRNDEALKEFSLILTLVPQNLNALENSAVILLDLGRPDESAGLLRKIIAIDPEILFAHYLLGEVDEIMGEIGEAWEEYHFVVARGEKQPQNKDIPKAKEKISQLGPSREAAVENARKVKEAYALVEKGETDRPEKIYQEVLRSAPENTLARFGLGLVLFSKNQDEEAKKIFLQVVEKEPEMLPLHFFLAKIYLKEKEIEKAFSELSKVLELGAKPVNSAKYKKNIDEAKKDLEQFGGGLKGGLEVSLLLKEGNELVKKEDFDQAREKFKRVLALAPQNLEALENLGLTYMRLTSFEPERAREMFEKMLAINPDLPAPNFRLGGIFENQGEIEKAISKYQKVAQEDQKEGGYGERSRKRLHQMGETAEKAHLLYPLLKEGRKLLDEKKWDSSLERYQQALQIIPDQMEALYSLGLIYLQQKEVEKAEKSFRDILIVDPENLDAHFQLGILLGALGKYESAEKELGFVVEKGKEGKTVQTAKAEIAQIREKSEAEGHFKKGMEFLVRIEEIQKKGLLTPEDPLALEKKKRADEAVRELTEAVKRNLDNPAYLFNLAVAYVHQGDLLSAEAVFKKTVQIKQDSMQAHYQLALLYEASGTSDWALKEYQAVIQYGNEGEKEVEEAKLKLEGLKGKVSMNEEAKGYSLVANFLYLELKENEKAGPLLLKTVELDPGNGNYWYDLGIFYESVGDQEKAESAYRKAIQLFPSFSKPYFYLGIILEKKGEVREAYEMFKKGSQYEVIKASKEAVLTEARIRFYEDKLRGSFSAAPFLYDNNPADSNRPAADYSASGNYALNLKYYYYKSLKTLISSTLNLSSYVFYYSQLEYSADSLSFEGYWPDWNGINLTASSSFGVSFAAGGINGWYNNTQGDFTRNLKEIGSMNTHIGYTYSISQINSFYNSTRASLNWSFFKEHFGAGSLNTQFGVTNSDLGASDDSNLSWNGTLTYSQPLVTYLNGSFSLGYGTAYYKNPDSFAQREGMGIVRRENKTLNLSASLSYFLYRNLTLSFRSGWERVESNLSTFSDRNIQDILTQLTSSIGSYTKMTFGTTINYSF